MRWYLRGVLLGIVMLAAAAAAGADEFRIETQVFAGEATEPSSTNRTLFTERAVYDFLSSPEALAEQVAVFQKSPGKSQGRFVLLDPVRQQRTEITTERLIEGLSAVQTWAASESDPLLKFAASPVFQENYDAEQQTMRFESGPMRYVVEAAKLKDERSGQQYHEFSDWYARLGAWLHPGSTPPFPRLMVNRALAARQLAPVAVRLEIPANKPYRRHDLKIRSEHRIAWRLTRHDRQRIDEANQGLVDFKAVDVDTFRRGK